MEMENAVRRAQLYGFLAEVFLYPCENWTEDVAAVSAVVSQLAFVEAELSIAPVTLAELQAIHRRTFGAAGSLCYETEYGLAHEYRQSQELADITGFYHAFGFDLGGTVRERPDHVAVELEFMHILALKEAYALEMGVVEHVEICLEAQRNFLKDHLGRWFGLFARSLALNTPGGPYPALARFAGTFIEADAARLGVELQQPQLAETKHTPFDPDFSCASCAVATNLHGVEP